MSTKLWEISWIKSLAKTCWSLCLCRRNWETSWYLWWWWKGRDGDTVRAEGMHHFHHHLVHFILALSTCACDRGGRGEHKLLSFDLVATYSHSHTRASTHTTERKSVCFEWNNAAQLVNVCKGLFKLWYSGPPRYWNFFSKDSQMSSSQMRKRQF